MTDNEHFRAPLPAATTSYYLSLPATNRVISLRFGPTQVLLIVLTWAVISVFQLINLPTEPTIGGDLQQFLEASEVRPHGYPLFLDLYRFGVGHLSYLPQTQALLLAISSLLLALATAWRVNNVLAAALVVGLSTYYGIRINTPVSVVMSDPLYEALLVSSAACLIWYFSICKTWLLIVASVFLSMAVIVRGIGYSVIPVFAGCVAISCYRLNPQRLLATILAAITPLLICLALAAASNLLRHGHFRIGTNTGIVLLGKGLVLAQPLSENTKFKSAKWVAESVTPVRQALRQIHNPILKALVVTQYYDNLRYFSVAPQWRLPEAKEVSGYELDRITRSLALEYILNDIRGYAELFALDYLSLWVIPRVLTASERNSLEHSYRALGPLPYLAEFEKTQHYAPYWAVVPDPSHWSLVLTVRTLSLAFLACSVALVYMLLKRATRTRLLEGNVDVLFLIGSVQASYVATALVEGGTFERYNAPTWPLMVAAVVLSLSLLFQRGKISRDPPQAFGP